MAEVIETIVLVFVFGGILIFTLSVGIKDLREAKAERKDCEKFRHSVDESLGKLDYLEIIANRSKNAEPLTYVERLRLHYSCCHCSLLLQCKLDARDNDPEFDYLVCEKFKEV